MCLDDCTVAVRDMYMYIVVCVDAHIDTGTKNAHLVIYVIYAMVNIYVVLYSFTCIFISNCSQSNSFTVYSLHSSYHFEYGIFTEKYKLRQFICPPYTI